MKILLLIIMFVNFFSCISYGNSGTSDTGEFWLKYYKLSKINTLVISIGENEYHAFMIINNKEKDIKCKNLEKIFTHLTPSISAILYLGPMNAKKKDEIQSYTNKYSRNKIQIYSSYSFIPENGASQGKLLIHGDGKWNTDA